MVKQDSINQAELISPLAGKFRRVGHNTFRKAAVGSAKLIWTLGTILAVAITAIAWTRVGMLDLPSVPSHITVNDAGLSDLNAMKALDNYIRPPSKDNAAITNNNTSKPEAAKLAQRGILLIQQEKIVEGIALLQQSLRLEPSNIVLGNAYRMTLFQLRREFLAQTRRLGMLTPTFPPHLQDEPIKLLQALADKHKTRETKIQLALAWVDNMLLFPALEIKAPSSVDSVNILDSILDGPDDVYIPALFARGLNHLHRPARLVWPESRKVAPDAAAQDIGRCLQIGRQLGVGSARLQAILAMTLGDAYIKAGRFGVARSWWQVAQNLCRETDIKDMIRRRYSWHDDDMLNELEAELDRSRQAMDNPMTDLAMMWN